MAIPYCQGIVPGTYDVLSRLPNKKAAHCRKSGNGPFSQQSQTMYVAAASGLRIPLPHEGLKQPLQSLHRLGAAFHQHVSLIRQAAEHHTLFHL